MKLLLHTSPLSHRFLSPPPLAAAMASRSSNGGGGGGRNQWRRAFSHRPGGERMGPGDSDSPSQSFREPNLGFRPRPQPYDQRWTHGTHQPPPPPAHGQMYNAVPPPPFYQNQTFHPPQPNGQNAVPPYYQNRTFRPLPLQFRSPSPHRPPDFRSWESTKSGTPHHSSVQFKVLSYNLLADYLAINHRSKLYFHIPRHMLDWHWRKRSIIVELGWWSADILCFQEVDRFQDLEEDLKLRGYSGIWKMRTGDPLDGCAIFWRDSRFKLLRDEFIEYNKLGLRDNVAQICVFELVNRNNDKGLSDSPGRLPCSNRVIVCNIHVLYNPKRGEIKLGQVRVLLDRAHAVSKLWDSAPVILCGDFNCTPKSPLYNYISEQRLDLSDLPRDQVSGQASAEIRPQWQFSPNIRAPRTSNYGSGAATMSDSGEIGRFGFLNIDRERNPGVSSVVPSNNCSPQFNNGTKICDGASMVEDCNNEIVVSSHEVGMGETRQETDCCENEAQSDSPVSSTHAEKPSSSQDGEDLFVKKLKDLNEPFAVDSSKKDIFHSSTSEASHITLDSCKDERSLVFGVSENSSVPISENAEIPKTSSKVNFSPESSPNIVLHEKMENLSLDGLDERNEGDEVLGEDSSTFLAELHEENVSVSHEVDFEPVNELSYSYDCSVWTPMEIESATGCADCKLLEHSLKLKSSYTEVEDLPGTRDSHGEPLVTSYNRCFMGTVDYIWHSEGLKTVRVLAPIPKQAMQWTAGYPTKKWGSDHIALISEFAFINDPITQNTEPL